MQDALKEAEARKAASQNIKEGKEAPYILQLKDYEVALAIISFILNKEK